ncbi:MAG: HAD-IIIC family phosphatase [Planctomycetota bacterium]|nr:HAD-IIIC family phosphatase [Planctomycetota bacterium]
MTLSDDSTPIATPAAPPDAAPAPTPTQATPAPRAGDDRLAGAVAAELVRHRDDLGLALVESIRDFPKFADDLRACEGDFSEFIQREFHALIDYLALYVRTGDTTWRDLYVGEKVKQAYEPGASPEQALERRRTIADADARAVERVFAGKLTPGQLALLRSAQGDIHRLVTAQGSVPARVLLVGDCLYLDIVAFLTAGAIEDGIAFQPTFLADKNPAELRASIRALAGQKFDAVFFSPFSYVFSLELARLQSVRSTLDGAGRLMEIVDATMAEVTATIDVIGEVFECNIFVHNSANIRRHEGGAAERIRNALTRRPRGLVRESINRRLAHHVASRNAATFEHLFVLDEADLLNRFSQDELGRKFYGSDLQHPAVLGRHLAAEYRDLLAVHAHLLRKKLVVTDLDNTLWRGTIGDGPVEHHADRQRTLQLLRKKGVVLAVASKNDPRNVRWDGAVLGPDDFVHQEIHWEPKVVGFKRIHETLNLKFKDFVFVDDRADERGMVAEACPGVFAMDALDERTWRLLATWARIAVNDGESDRTKLYKERAQREQFLKAPSSGAAAEDPSKLFATLGIACEIRDARTADLKRVAELVNRTNQFNLCGSRTSLREMTAWSQDGRRRIIRVDAADKFGSMGTVAVLVLELSDDVACIPLFVLSCRVFGYGIEHALLAAVMRLLSASGRGDLPIEGLFVETPHNEPSRKVYPANGFTWTGQAWRCDRPEPKADPSWLKVSTDLAPLPQG